MKIIFRNGEELECQTIVLDDKDIFADGRYLFPLASVERIEDDTI